MNGLKRNLKGLLFISPWLVGFSIFGVYPMGMAIYLSFTNYNILQPATTKFIGLANLTRMINDPLFWKSLINTGWMTGVGVPITIVLGVLIAIPLSQNMRGVSLYRTLIYLPTLIPPLVVTLLFLWILNPNYGLLKVPFQLLNIPSPGWLADPTWSKPAILIMVVWNTLGQVIVISLAGLRDIPRHLYEAAEIDGAGRYEKFLNVTLPGLSSVIFYNVLTTVLFFLQIFTQAYAASAGGSGGGGTAQNIGAPVNSTLMLSLNVYKNAFGFWQAGYASMMSLVILILSLVLAGLFFRFARSSVHYGFSVDPS
jgi:multiple sugar transport system permease protein